MADLKAGSTVGGLPIWHQGTFPLTPVGNILTYRNFKVYTENDKPQASNNDFVSKASGGTYLGKVQFGFGFGVGRDGDPNSTNGGGIVPGNGDGATMDTVNMDIVSWQGIGFKSSNTNVRSVFINVRTGDMTLKGLVTANQFLASATAPTLAGHLTRKDYVDTQISSVNSNANTRVLRAGDTMTGLLTAPQFASNNDASRPEHVPRLSQVITKGTIIDFGTF